MWKFNKDNWVYIAEDNIEDFLKNNFNTEYNIEVIPSGQATAKSVISSVVSEKPKKRSKKAKTAIQT